MSTLDVTRSYSDGAALTEAMLDSFLDDIETFVNTTKLNDDNIQNAGITASDKLIDASISTAKLAASAVTTAKIADLNVTTDKLAASAVTTAKITDLNVTTGKINDLAVTTAKIAAANVTRAKLESVGQQVSSSSGSVTRTSTTFADITNLTVTITTTGRPVFVGLMNDGTAADSYIGTNQGNDDDAGGRFRLFRDSTDIAYYQLRIRIESGGSTADPILRVPCSSFWYLDTPAAGTYTYKVQYAGVSASDIVECAYAKLIAYEL